MKKKWYFFTIFLITIAIVFLAKFTLAADFDKTEEDAYNCLLSRVAGEQCEDVDDVEDKIFALLATGHCLDEVMEESINDKYWPASGEQTSIELTAKALIALLDTDEDTDRIADYLLTQNSTPDDIDWFLQIEADGYAECDITYDSTTIEIHLEEDKSVTVLQPGFGCLNAYSYNPEVDPYWLKINGLECSTKIYSIECTEPVYTNFIYRNKNADSEDPYFVGFQTQGPDTKIDEQIDSLCFREGNECNFEGTIWAAMALDAIGGYDMEPFLPYIIANTPLNDNTAENAEYLPEAAVYRFRSQYAEYWESLKEDQYPDGFFTTQTSPNSEYYDTAFALLPLQNQNRPQKQLAMEWLNETQKSSGCWGESTGTSIDIGDTAFVLFSIWPRSGLGPECSRDSDCPEGYECNDYGSCVPEGTDCETGKDYQCPGDEVCVDNMCVECRYDDDCEDEDKPYCVEDADYTCQECGKDSNCIELKGDGWGCDLDDWECYQLPDCDVDDPNSCEPGFQCIGGFCMGGFPECDIDDDCTNEYEPFCIDDICVECLNSSHCVSGYECENNHCISKGCINNSDCTGGQICSSGSCIDPDVTDCQQANYFCRSFDDCESDGGNILYNYDCAGLNFCCDLPGAEKPCADLGGIICTASEQCDGGQEDKRATDTKLGEICCVDGTCSAITNECTRFNTNGECKTVCDVGEVSSTDSCPSAGQICCVPEGPSPPPEPEPSPWGWIIFFSILIILVVLGIIYRDKLRVWFMQIKSKFGGKKPPPRRGGPPGFPPPRGPPSMMRRPISPRPRRIFPPGAKRPMPQRGSPPKRPMPPPKKAPETPKKPQESSKPGGELKDILKKLKEIGK